MHSEPSRIEYSNVESQKNIKFTHLSFFSHSNIKQFWNNLAIICFTPMHKIWLIQTLTVRVVQFTVFSTLNEWRLTSSSVRTRPVAVGGALPGRCLCWRSWRSQTRRGRRSGSGGGPDRYTGPCCGTSSGTAPAVRLPPLSDWPSATGGEKLQCQRWVICKYAIFIN